VRIAVKTSVIVLAMAFVAAVAAQDKPDFSGEWKLPGGPNRWSIAVEGSKMTVTLSMAGNPHSTVYMLDGTPSKTIPCPGCKEATFTSKWEGNVLVTEMTTLPTPIKEWRSMQKDGTMKVETLRIFNGEPMKGTMILSKVK